MWSGSSQGVPVVSLAYVLHRMAETADKKNYKMCYAMECSQFHRLATRLASRRVNSGSTIRVNIMYQS
jgi:hypothetical protein